MHICGWLQVKLTLRKMRNDKLLNFTFIVEFRGGTYCTQVLAKDVYKSVLEWIKNIKINQSQIQYLGDKIIEELKIESKEKDNRPILLNGLKNTWHTIYSTKKGTFSINIVQTDIQ